MPLTIQNVLDLNCTTVRKNIQIFMCCYNLSQADICKALGKSKGYVSKQINGVDNYVGKTFLEDFCLHYELNPKHLDAIPIVFYAYIYNEKRRKEIEQTGVDPGSYINKEYLKYFHFKEKYKSQSNIRINFVKTKIDEEEIKQIGDEETDDAFDVVEKEIKQNPIIQSTYEVRMFKKDAMVKIPVYTFSIMAVSLVVAMITAYIDKDAILALAALLIIPISDVVTIAVSKLKYKFHFSETCTFYYERSEEIKETTYKFIYIIGLAVELIFGIWAVISTISVEGVNEVLKYLMYGIVICGIALSAGPFINNSKESLFPKILTNSAYKADKDRQTLFFFQMLTIVVLGILVVLDYCGLIVLLFRILMLIIDGIGYFLGKYYINKYQLYKDDAGDKKLFSKLIENQFGEI